jgi:AmiR/NasT family two-component response regulator
VHRKELVSNADLSFMTREFARELPQRLADHEQFNEAVSVLMALRGWPAAEARERLDYAAMHAKTSPSSVARMVMVLDT